MTATVVSIAFSQARLCLEDDCETVFGGGMSCPVCGSSTWVYLHPWLSARAQRPLWELIAAMKPRPGIGQVTEIRG